LTEKKEKNRSFQEINSAEFIARLKTDGELMNSAFRTLVNVTHNPLLYFIKRFIHSTEEAQEVLQEVYLGVHKGIKNFQGKSKLTTWIYSLTHNKVCDKISDKKWQHEEYSEFKESVSGIDTKDNMVSKSTEWDTSPEKLSSIKQVQKRLPEIIKSLSENLKEVYLLRDVDGLSGSEVADLLEITEEAVRVRLHRARNFIVDKMKIELKSESTQPENPTVLKP